MTKKNIFQNSQSSISFENINIFFDDNKVVENLTFNINRGETFCLVGESGSGKSVSALATIRLLPENALVNGKIIFIQNNQETNLLECSDEQIQNFRGSKIAFIFQEPMTSLNPVLTIGEQIVEVLLEHNPELSQEMAFVLAINSLTAVQINNPQERFYNYPHQLSGGQRQRVMIAMALVGKPDLLIADEPTTALDVTIQAEILTLLQNLQKQTGMSILFITHDFGVVAKIADKVGVMAKGRLVEWGKTAQILNNPKDIYTKKLLDAVPENLPPVDFVYNNQQLQDSENILVVKKLKIYFPIKKGFFRKTCGYIKAVDEVSIFVKDRHILALVGESGCGKTTFGKALVALTKPLSGEIIFQGENLNNLPAEKLRQTRAQIQMVFQDPLSSLNPRLKIVDTLTMPMKAHNIGQNYDERVELAKELLTQVQLPLESLWRYPHAFSGGQRQRISLARALSLSPKVIVCDEITSALDVSVQAEVLFLLQEIRAKRNLALIFITHNIGVVEYLCDTTAIMKDGKIVEIGKTRDVSSNPQHPYTQKLLSAVPRIK